MTNETTSLSRGLLSKRTGVNSETIRYYEKIRLMPEPLRSAKGYRIYDDSHLKRLSFIRRCRELGFTLKEVAALLMLVDGGDYTCEEINNVDKKIKDLKIMQRTLSNMVSACDADMAPGCPIVDELFDT
jgi:MerR family mercuric resistance operon transcriptional regulator